MSCTPPFVHIHIYTYIYIYIYRGALEATRATEEPPRADEEPLGGDALIIFYRRGATGGAQTVCSNCVLIVCKSCLLKIVFAQNCVCQKVCQIVCQIVCHTVCHTVCSELLAPRWFARRKCLPNSMHACANNISSQKLFAIL